MILVTHGIIGAAVGRFFPANPILAFFAGLLSHFVFDAIPHWHYPLSAIDGKKASSGKSVFTVKKRIILDAFIIALDFFMGVWLAMLIFNKNDYSNYSAFAGAIGGLLPDGLMFLSWILRIKILKLFDKFHIFIHSKIDIDSWFVIGPLSQVAIIAIVVFVSKIILK